VASVHHTLSPLPFPLATSLPPRHFPPSIPPSIPPLPSHLQWIGSGNDTAGNSLKVSSVTSFGVNDLYFTTAVTLQNTGPNVLYEVRTAVTVCTLWRALWMKQLLPSGQRDAARAVLVFLSRCSKLRVPPDRAQGPRDSGRAILCVRLGTRGGV
jgi:hypothetical protein